MKIEHDKYYTDLDTIDKCNEILREHFDFNDITSFFDPSCGDDRWMNRLGVPHKSQDKFPDNGIAYGDFLNEEYAYDAHRCIITNPPYGDRNVLTLQFINKALDVAGYVAMLVPYSTENSIKIPKPDKVFPMPQSFSDVVGVKVALLIWLPNTPRIVQKGRNWNENCLCEIGIFALNHNFHTYTPMDGDIMMCAWGAGSLFNIVDYDHPYNTNLVIRLKEEADRKTFTDYIEWHKLELRKEWTDLYGEKVKLKYPKIRELINRIFGKDMFVSYTNGIQYKIFALQPNQHRNDWYKYLPSENDVILCAWGCGTIFKIVTDKPYNKNMIVRFENGEQKSKFIEYLDKNIKTIRADYIAKYGETCLLSYPQIRELLSKVFPNGNFSEITEEPPKPKSKMELFLV